MAFLFSDSNVLYSAALLLVIAFFVLELLGLLVGFSLMAMLDDLLPVDIEGDISTEAPSQLLSWLSLDRLPFMIWLVIWLTTFASTGFLWTSVIGASIPFGQPFILHTLVAVFAATALTGLLGRYIAKMIPKQQSSAIDMEGLAGSTGQITLGVATQGSPAEAKLTDAFGQVHYLMVEPIEQDTFRQGETVILVKKGPHGWLAMRYQQL